MNRYSVTCLVALMAAFFLPAAAPGKEAADRSIPPRQIGIEAEKQYAGDGISITPKADGAQLRVVFQKLEGCATKEGVWLKSTVKEEGGVSGRFRVSAVALRRSPKGAGSILTLPKLGTVSATSKMISFQRPTVNEEFTVSMDGVRQDFLVTQRLKGAGELEVILGVDGAKAAAAPYGADLMLDGSERRIAYSRLRVTDASGRELISRMEPLPDGRQMRVVIHDDCAVYPVRIDPTFSDANWISIGGPLGTDGTVTAAVTDASGNLFIGGYFKQVGSTMANNLARWDGTNWWPLGIGTDGPVDALAISGSTLFIGGYFTRAGGVVVNNIAQWNGTSFGPVGPGFNGSVNALAVSGTDLYAGGDFYTVNDAGSTLVRYVAKWNGTAWSSMGGGVSDGDISTAVYALAVSGSNVYVGGHFTKAGGVTVNNLGLWNGSSWESVGGGVTEGLAGPNIRAIAVAGTDLYVTGAFSKAGGVTAINIAKWNGSVWTPLGAGFNSGGLCLGISGPYLYAGGYFAIAGDAFVQGIAKWDGASWAAVGGSVNLKVLALTPAGSDGVYAGGDFSAAGGTAMGGIALWDGSAWNPIGQGMNGEVLAVALSGSNLYAGGTFTHAGGVTANHIAKWDGSTWSSLGSGMVASSPSDSSTKINSLAVFGGDLYAGGFFNNAGGTAVNNLARWNGSTWSTLDGGSTGQGLNGPVNALVFSGNTLYAGGSFNASGGTIDNSVSARWVAKWDGTAWSALGTGMNAVVDTLALYGTELVAGGAFTTAGGQPANYIAKWNGTAWSALGSGMNDDVEALAVSGSTLYAGGYFTTAGGVTANLVAKWDGSSWSPMGTGLRGSYGEVVYALTAVGSDVYAGGYFKLTKSGGIKVNYLGWWNGSTWSPVGSGPNDKVNALVTNGTDIYVGGRFTTAGNKSSAYVSRLNLADLTQAAAMTGPAPGSALGPNSTTFSWNSGVGASAYSLWIGNTVGTADIYSGDEGTNLSKTITSLPGDGRVLYVTLRSLIGGTYRSNAYTYTAYRVPTPVKAQITAPLNGSALNSTSLPLSWTSGTSVTSCYLFVGTTPGGYEVYAGDQGTSLARTVAVPAGGGKIYVTLWSLIHGSYQGNHYLFTSVASDKAALSGAVNGSTLSSGTLDLTWTAGTGVSKYVIWIGSTYGGYDIAAADVGTSVSRSFNVPQDGRPVYVTLWSLINGGWQGNNYWFNAADPVSGSRQARITSHPNTSTLSSAMMNLAWDQGSGVTTYALWVGSSPNGYDLYSGLEGTNLSKNVAVPGDGRRIYVTLHSLISSAYQSNSYWFTAPTLPDGGAAQVTDPVNGSTLADATLPLVWSSAAGATQYYIFAGSTPGGYDLYAGSQGTSLSRTLSGMPVDGRVIYVTLYSWLNGAWKQSSAWFTTANTASGNRRALITSPVNGTTLPGASTTFNWGGGVGATSYALWIGSSAGAYDLWSSAEALATTSRTVTLPTDGRKLYVTLYSFIGGAWQGASYLYTASNLAVTKAAMTFPANGSTFTGASQSFTWSASNAATMYALWIGRYPGGYDIYAGAEGLNTTRTVPTLPTDGSPVYVTLYSLINGAWQSNEYIYNAALPP